MGQGLTFLIFPNEEIAQLKNFRVHNSTSFFLLELSVYYKSFDNRTNQKFLKSENPIFQIDHIYSFFGRDGGVQSGFFFLGGGVSNLC